MNSCACTTENGCGYENGCENGYESESEREERGSWSFYHHEYSWVIFDAQMDELALALQGSVSANESVRAGTN